VIVLLLEISRRIVGTTFTLVVAGFLIYMYFGNHFPAVISHKGYDLDRIVGHMFMTLEGIFGVPLSVSASFVMLFVVYGTFNGRGGGRRLLAGPFARDDGQEIRERRTRRGDHLGAAGGAPGERVATTMSVTPIMWPILQKAGYTPNMAAGLIATGGIGAVLSPPLMGAAAFLIMQFLGVAFWDVVVMVTVPTVLYYAGTLFIVELEARRYNFAPPDTEAKTVRQVMRNQRVPPAVDHRAGGDPRALEQVARIRGAGRHRDRDRDQFLEPGPERVADPRRILVAMIEGRRTCSRSRCFWRPQG